MGLVQKRRGSAADPVSEDDLLRAIEKLKTLGGGFGVVKIGTTQFVRSVPKELNTDTNAVIELAQVGGCWRGVLGGPQKDAGRSGGQPATWANKHHLGVPVLDLSVSQPLCAVLCQPPLGVTGLSRINSNSTFWPPKGGPSCACPTTPRAHRGSASMYVQKKGGFLTTAQIAEGLKWSEARIKGAWTASSTFSWHADQ